MKKMEEDHFDTTFLGQDALDPYQEPRVRRVITLEFLDEYEEGNDRSEVTESQEEKERMEAETHRLMQENQAKLHDLRRSLRDRPRQNYTEVNGDQVELATGRSDRKRALMGTKWKDFQKKFVHSVPRSISETTSFFQMYYDEMFVRDEETIHNLTTSYMDMMRIFVSYYARGQGLKVYDTKTIVDIQENMTGMAWKLFVGLKEDDLYAIFKSREKQKLNYVEVHTILDWFEELTDDQVLEIKRYRNQQRLEFIGGDLDFRVLELNGVHWLVHRDFKLPWVIPINYHWHNPRAVRPHEATISEMVHSGRLVQANDRIYQLDQIYKALIPAVNHLSLQIAPHGDNLDVWVNWDAGDNFFWYKPPYQVVVVPSGDVGYSMMLSFDQDAVDANLEKIFVPNGTLIYPIVGEIRVLDDAVSDDYGFDYVQQRNPNGAFRKPTNLVVTMYSSTRKGPAVGNAGFMANCTCGSPAGDPPPGYSEANLIFFELYEAMFGNKEKNCIKNFDYIYKHVCLKAVKDIKGSWIKWWNDKNTEWIDLCPGKYLFPVEFVYNTYDFDKPGEQCCCLTHCAYSDYDLRPRMSLINGKTITRTVHENLGSFLAEERPKMKEAKREQLNDYLKQFGLDGRGNRKP